MATKGHTNNPAGRPKGQPNKITGHLREAIIDFIEGNFDEVVRDWRAMDPKDKLNFYRDLIQFVIPKMQSTDITTNYQTSAEEAKEVHDKYFKSLANNIEEYYNAGRIQDYIDRLRKPMEIPTYQNR